MVLKADDDGIILCACVRACVCELFSDTVSIPDYVERQDDR
jgi:hypothetical protein